MTEKSEGRFSRRALLKMGSGVLLAATLTPTEIFAMPPPANPNAIPTEDAFFGLLDLTQPALAEVKIAAAAKDWPAAKAAWAKHLASANRPHWLWSRTERPRITQIYRERYHGLESYVPAADAVLARDFDLQGIKTHLEHDLDWHPVPGEWTNVLNRFAYWPVMGYAYWATGDAKYAADFVYQLERWVAKNPVPADARKSFSNSQSCWRTLECGIRTPNWIDALELFMDAPEFDAEAKYQMSKAFAEHARYLTQQEDSYHAGNWQVVECTGLSMLGIMFPEFSDSATWRKMGFHYLVEHMQKDVEPDGMHWEMTPEYHATVMSDYVAIAELCRRNGIEVPGLLDRHEKMFEALMNLCRPDKYVYPLGDCHEKMNIESFMGVGALLYQRPDMRYLATDTIPSDWVWTFGPQVLDAYPKLKKAVPASLSVLMPSSQYIAMRTGWEAHDSSLLFDCAPWHGGHNHLDSLQVLLYAGGRDLVIDPGIGDYDAEASKTYMRTTEAHSTVMVDGKQQPHADATLLAWETTPSADFASGRLTEDGFTHQRSVLFIKPGYWLVVDTVTAAEATDTAAHVLTRRFHLPPDTSVQSDAVSARSSYSKGVNIHILPLDFADSPPQIESEKGFVPGPRRTAAPSPVAALINRGALPITPCCLLIPLDNPQGLPVVKRLPAADPQVVQVSLRFPDGQQDDILISPGVASLTLDAHTAPARALCVRRGPNANALLALGNTVA